MEQVYKHCTKNEVFQENFIFCAATHWNNENSTNSGIYETIYHNGSASLLFGIRQ